MITPATAARVGDGLPSKPVRLSNPIATAAGPIDSVVVRRATAADVRAAAECGDFWLVGILARITSLSFEQAYELSRADCHRITEALQDLERR